MKAALLLLLSALPAAAQCVRVQHDTDTPGTVAMGSGVLVWSAAGESLVLTCWHVVPDGRKPIAVVADHPHPAEFVAADDRCDLALVRVRAALSPVAPLSGTAPAPGRAVTVGGFPNGGPFRSAAGAVCRERAREQVWTPFGPVGVADELLVDVVVEPGNSGGPVYDGAGGLCGIVHSRSVVGGRGAAPAGCTGLADVRRFLAAHGVK